MGRALGAVTARVARRPRWILAVCVAIALLGAALATRAPIESGVDQLIDSDNPAYQETRDVSSRFGGDPIVVLVKGDLEKTLQPPDLLRIMNLEACLSGVVPEDARPLPGPCRELSELRPAQLVSGPATFLNQAATGIGEQLSARVADLEARADQAAQAAFRQARQKGVGTAQARARAEQARQQVVSRFLSGLLSLAGRYGLTGPPDLGDPNFTSAVVFDPEEPPGTPKERFAYLFPGPDSAQIIVRLRDDLTEAEHARAIGLIERAVAYEQPEARCSPTGSGSPQPCFELQNGEYVLSGAPIVIDALSEGLRSALIVLLAIAVAVMAVVLAAVFRSSKRLLPLGLAIGSCAVTFGIWSVVGGTLSVAAIAALPILTGLAVDYAIQLQARFNEVGGDPGKAGSLGGPIVGTAAIATAAAFAVLAAAPTPMVREFGLILALGVAVSYVFALLAGTAALTSGDGRQQDVAPTPIAQNPWVTKTARRALRASRLRPLSVILAGLLIAGAGWVAGARMDTVTDITKLAPSGISDVESLVTLQEETGVSGQIDVMVEGADPTDPDLIAWMAGFRERVLDAGGYDTEDPECSTARVCPGPSLDDFFAPAGSGSSEPLEGLTRKRIRSVISALPPGQLKGVVEVNSESGELGDAVNVPFLITLMPLERQQQMIESVREAVRPDPDGPEAAPLPDGAEVKIGGLTVIAAEAADELESERHLLVGAGILVVALVLLAMIRSLVYVGIALLPIVLATGWSGALLGSMSVPLNPISAVLGVMVVAIGTEFSVILTQRFRQERARKGSSVAESLQRTYAQTGTAVAASGVTVIAGFAVLVASDVQMLREFGLVTVVDLGVALGGVMLVLPAALVIGERLRGRR